MDQLSDLPDSLIHHIFSFLPMEDVVRTTILSKRWKDLWTTVPCLSFRAESGELDKFRNFVNRTMMLWRGTKIQKFSACSMLLPDISLFHDQHVWVRRALQHKVEELNLFNLYIEDTGFLPPQCLFSSSSIRKLSLNGCDIVFHGDIHWDQLKSLKIHNFYVDQSVINKVLAGSPQLEIFELCCGQNVNIYSSSLKKLSLDYDAEDYYFDVGADEIDPILQIGSPNLEVLTISGSVCNKSLFLSVPSLIEANLEFSHPTYSFDGSPFDYELHGDMLKVIFQGMKHVEKLQVGDWCIKVLKVMRKTALPLPLLKLKYLTIDTRAGIDDLVGIVNLLEISPNVAMLTIENSYITDEDEEEFNNDHGFDYYFGDGSGDHDDEDDLEHEWWHPEDSVIPEVELSDLFLMNVRILEIKLLAYHESVFSLAEFMLKRARALEKIVINVVDNPNRAFGLLYEMRKLLRMPRPSTNAQIALCRFRPYEEP